ncbi:MAG: hypothetical protein ACPLTR_08445 [Thermacetogeniaceae bacterium]
MTKVLEKGQRVSIRYVQKDVPSALWPGVRGEVVAVYPRFAVVKTEKGYCTTIHIAELMLGECLIFKLNPTVAAASGE